MKRAPVLALGLSLALLGLLLWLSILSNVAVQASQPGQGAWVPVGNESPPVSEYENSQPRTAISLTKTYVPFVVGGRAYGMEEDFESGAEDWQPFLNYWRLKPEQWYLQADTGYGGTTGMRHGAYVSPPQEATHALLMYEGVGAEQWTDYRVEAWVQMEAGERMGLWVRGKYLPDPAAGLHVEGYYVSWQPEVLTDSITLWRIPVSGTYAYHFGAAEVLSAADHWMDLDTWYDLAVQVQAERIRIFVNGSKILEYEDDVYLQGAVGLYAYKAASATWDDVRITFLDSQERGMILQPGEKHHPKE